LLALAYYIFNFTKSGAEKGSSLAEQAGRLLEVQLWGIGSKTPNKDRLAAGDKVLIYVGAPERLLIGEGTLSSGVRSWTPDEALVYPGDWSAGVSFSEAFTWERPVPIKDVWPRMSGSVTNPKAQFFAGVVQIKQRDYEFVVTAAAGAPAPDHPTSDRASSPASDRQPTPSSEAIEALYACAEKVRHLLVTNSTKKLTEAATRALFIDPVLQALGYREFEDIDYGVQVQSKDFADYVLNVKGKPAIVVEAKRFGTKLDVEHAAQVIKYASVLGVRWGLVTDGRTMRLYDRIPNVPPQDRLVFEVDLTDYADREDFEVTLYPDLELLSKSAMIQGIGLERRAAQQAVRDILSDEDSRAIEVLRDELAQSQLAHLTRDELVDLLQELL
jgi:type I restriction and modification enzyme subunit R-like protein